MMNAEGRQVPVPFTLTYDPAKIDPAHRYSVRATIRSADGMLMFSSTQAYPVLTHGAPSKVTLILHTVGHGAKPGVAAKKAATSPVASGDANAPSQAAPSSNAEPAPASSATPQVSDTAPSAATPSAAEPAPPASSEGSKGDNLAPAEQQIVIKPQAAPNSEITIPGSATESKEATPPAVTATGESANPAVTQEGTPAPTATAPSTPSASEPPSPAEASAPPATAAPETPTVPPDSKPAEAPPATAPEQTAPSETKNEPTVASPEAKTTAPEAPLPEAPSATKHSEIAAAPEASATTPEPEGESTSRPELSASKKASTPLASTQWKLIQLAGQEIDIAPPQKPVTLAFSPEGRRIAGSAGCNSYIGTFSDDHGRLQLSPGNMTMMACVDPAGSRERKFIAMLRSADGYKISGDFLLLTSNGKTVAKFKNNQ